MNDRDKAVPKPVRLVFELARADNPRLFDELVQFPQGVKRVNRLRVLAYDGLLAQFGVFALTSGITKPPPALPLTEVTNGLFEPALKE
ncbi:MAG: hypothetical protein KIT17_09440 [Rubrivivax sp.]|nr:hypothetical protein [Burkholderiales bacterium]MCW5633548.1 hypothetical protein [Rubrivivax sp.]